MTVIRVLQYAISLMTVNTRVSRDKREATVIYQQQVTRALQYIAAAAEVDGSIHTRTRESVRTLASAPSKHLILA